MRISCLMTFFVRKFRCQKNCCPGTSGLSNRLGATRNDSYTAMAHLLRYERPCCRHSISHVASVRLKLRRLARLRRSTDYLGSGAQEMFDVAFQNEHV